MKIQSNTEFLYPVNVIKYFEVNNPDNLMLDKELNVSFYARDIIEFGKKGSYVLLDFGKELCGGIRIITRETDGIASFHIRLGESVSEAMADLGDKNAGNDHSPRDFTVSVNSLSDLTFGQSGFRFAYIELVSEMPVLIQCIVAVNNVPHFPFEAKIKTDDEEINKILDTAAYTLKLCCQNGVIWDGIKRDRLIWAGDLHQEILTSLYLFGDNENVRNSLSFVKNDTGTDKWMNWAPSYSAWWIISLCDYFNITGNKEFFNENKSYAEKTLKKMNTATDTSGYIDTSNSGLPYFLDWHTYETGDAVIGTTAIFILAAKCFLHHSENIDAKELLRKLMPTLEKSKPATKQALAFRKLALECECDIASRLEEDGAHGLSTFMAYYILKADIAAGGKNILKLIKEYFGGMLSRGATTFWEDFDIAWIENSCRIDELPKANQKDIHGDFGRHCYKNFRHSLCHGWSSGIFSLFVENILGLKIENGEIVSIKPNLFELNKIEAVLPIGKEKISITVDNNDITVNLLSELR